MHKFDIVYQFESVHELPWMVGWLLVMKPTQ